MGIAPIWAESPAPPLPKWLCLLLHHSPTAPLTSLLMVYPLGNFVKSNYCRLIIAQIARQCYIIIADREIDREIEKNREGYAISV
ncbi:MAG: hypothetical protein A2Z77_05350 [Chloroflexi bacterium RBG_13_51_36]|nr:MAG: hypothetical protein A2Z77_05350 [Chloroflexi bacterium RBG_13_51_36]